jgi:hypothetical protein
LAGNAGKLPDRGSHYTVLGIRFNTNKMEWSLQKKKADELIRKILWAVKSDSYSLKETQQLLG